ncbi:MAG: alpha-amylase family glycosyl hydrolase [candidate division WOR-3 bacterium]|nr:alpha-amylase family glycosyl hydrolase [candidate division WOR-3 bacterium]
MRNISIIFVLFTTISSGITPDVLIHNPYNIFYLNPVMGEIRLKANRGAILEAYVLYGGKKTQMNIGFLDSKFDYFIADLGIFDTTFNYQILVKDKSDSLILPPAGTFKCSQTPFIVPNWAYGKVYYSVFLDGFYNGNKKNDPPDVVIWNKSPDREYHYGGDLAGIIEKLPYLDSLNFDVLLLQPFLAAGSNHKYDSRDYANIDIGFGDTLELKRLINEIHLRKKYIILKFIVTHTSSNFAGFMDVIKNGANSKYYNWFNIHSLPIKTSPPSYECWANDARFPRFNLKEPSVQAFLIGYIDYWLHFGFDGVYIGEDSVIESEFVRIMKTTLKKKYPNILILGCQDNIGINGFDGTINRKIVDLIIDYFALKKITTSEFDNELRKVLFFTPSQANLINLIDLSDFNKRIASLALNEDLLLVYAFLFTTVGSPVITYGDEVGMSEGKFLNMGSFPWTVDKQNRSLLENIKRLIAIRRENPLLTSKYFYPLYVNDINRVYAYDRGGIITIINGGDNPSYTILPVWNGTYINLMTGEKLIITTQQLRLSLPAKSFRIFKREI